MSVLKSFEDLLKPFRALVQPLRVSSYRFNLKVIFFVISRDPKICNLQTSSIVSLIRPVDIGLIHNHVTL